MSSKRRADKYLTDQNWDEDEESEEAGKFEAAPVDILKQRTFKKAKRRIAQAGEVILKRFSTRGSLNARLSFVERK